MNRKEAAISKYASTSPPRKKVQRKGILGSKRLEYRSLRGKVLCGAMSLAGRSDRVHGDHWRRPGFAIGFLPSTVHAPCRVLQWSSKFTRKMVKSSLGGQVYAFSEMADRAALLRDFFNSSVDLQPRMVGLEGCEGPFAHLENRRAIAGEYLVRHLAPTQQALEPGAFWLPGPGNPAEGQTRVKIDVAPLLSLLMAGSLFLGSPRSLNGAATHEYPGK